MAKKIKSVPDVPGAIENPGEFTIAEAATPDTPYTVEVTWEPAPQPEQLRYIGPHYDKGIQLGGTRTLIRPAEFNAEQIAEFIKKHPARRHWWSA